MPVLESALREAEGRLAAAETERQKWNRAYGTFMSNIPVTQDKTREARIRVMRLDAESGGTEDTQSGWSTFRRLFNESQQALETFKYLSLHPMEDAGRRVSVIAVRGAAGSLQVREGKTENAERTVPLLPRLATMIKRRAAATVDQFVFTRCLPTYLCRLHSRVRAKMGLPSDFVIHGLRHAMLTRLAEVGTDLSTLNRDSRSRSIFGDGKVRPSFERVEGAGLREAGGRVPGNRGRCAGVAHEGEPAEEKVSQSS